MDGHSHTGFQLESGAIVSEFMNVSWQMIAVGAAVYLVVRRVFRPRRETAPVTQGPSLSGRIGGHLIAHAVMSVVSGLLGFNVVIAIVTILLAIPLMLIGAKVELPDFVKAWPRSVASRFTGAFAEEEEVMEDAAVETEEEEVAPIDFDKFWGGAPESEVDDETITKELLEFDALRPDQKLMALKSAIVLEPMSVPWGLTATYDIAQWYRVRVGRSTRVYMDEADIELHRTLWTAEQCLDRSIDVKSWLHCTRLSRHTSGGAGDCGEAFNKMPPAAVFAILKAAKKVRRPLPAFMHMAEGAARDQQFYEYRTCAGNRRYVLASELDEVKDIALERMKEEELLAQRDWRERPARLADAVRDKAKDAMAKLRPKVGKTGAELTGKAQIVAKKGAKTMFWKAMGY